MLGLLCSLLTSIVMADNSRMYASESMPSYGSQSYEKPDVYFVLHGTQIVCLVLSICFSLFIDRPRHEQKDLNKWLAWYIVLCVVAFITSLRTYSLEDWLGKKAIHPGGVICYVLCGIALISISPYAWKVLDKCFMCLAGVLSISALILIGTLRTGARWETVATLNGLLNPLFWYASWTLLRPHSKAGLWANSIRFIPLSVVLLCAVLTQIRLHFVMVILTLIASLYAAKRRRRVNIRSSATVMFSLLTGVLVLLLVLPWLAQSNATKDFFELPYTQLLGRLFDDTRSPQLSEFFLQVSPLDLLLGKGAFASYTWSGSLGADYASGVENLYVSLAFYGGAPLLIAFCGTLLLPAVRVLNSQLSDIRLSLSLMVVLWFLRMAISTSLSVSLDFYVLPLCVGGCLRVRGRGATDTLHFRSGHRPYMIGPQRHCTREQTTPCV